MSELRPMRLIFAGGGTGGHLFPAIAIANRIRDLLEGRFQTEILFVGTKRGIEYRRRDSIGYPLQLINMRGLVRSLSWKNLLLPFVIVGALMKASSLLGRFRPMAVVGTGGYVAWPVLNRAAARGIPTFLQEQNSFPGIVTRRCAEAAAKVYLGFEGARSFLPGSADTVVTGNPVRTEIGQGDRNAALDKFGLDQNKTTILVLGGSQGAHAVNQAVLKSLDNGSLTSKYQLLWQTGKRDYKDVAAKAGDRVTGRSLFPFAESMSEVYAAADLAVARAGALTLAELIECRVPSILVPYPFAAGDHQRKNGQEMVDLGMAEMIDEKNLETRDLLAEAITLHQSDRFANMRDALKRYTENRRPAVDVIAEDIVRTITQGADN